MYYLIWFAIIYLILSVEKLKKNKKLRKGKDKIYQIDIFISPNIENIGKEIVKETKNKYHVRYKSARGIKKYDCWDMGNCGWFYDKRRFGYSDLYVTQPNYNPDKKIDMPIRITQISNSVGKALYTFDNIEKEPWFNGKSFLSFNYCQFELRNEDNMITFLPLVLDCGAKLELDIKTMGILGYEKHLCSFPFLLVIRDMMLDLWLNSRKSKMDKSEKQYKIERYIKQKLVEEGFEYIPQDSFDSNFERIAEFNHKYVNISIVIMEAS
ncbi:MAG: hypothetical protein IJ479_02395 [Alphaproteobacteria bacterium]|nr:hypothetical protein [Alphaproteobacteria bacterium]